MLARRTLQINRRGLFLKLQSGFTDRAEEPQGEELADGNCDAVPPIGDAGAAPAPQGVQPAAGAPVGRNQGSEPHADSLPAGRQAVEVGGDACRTNRRDADSVLVHLLGEADGELPQVGFRGAVQRQPRKRHPLRVGGHVQDAALHAAANHVGGEQAAELGVGQVVQQNHPLSHGVS